MKKVIKLFRLIMVVALLWCPAMLSAQAVGTKHIVERGETLQSISQKYGVTEQQIIDQNPDAAQFIYVGMELNIPIKQNADKSSSDVSVLGSVKPQHSDTVGFLTTEYKPSNLNGQYEISRYPKDRFGVTVHGYFGADIIKYGANIGMEGLVKGGNHPIGIDFSVGWNVMWNPKFDISSCVFGLGPFWCTRIENIDFYLPLQLICVAYLDGNDKWHTNWGCRINPLICINIFSCGIFADLSKEATFGLSFGLLW